MADQTFPVTSGFYDSVNLDRTYTADDMNKPYKRIVADGVFATQQGTPSDDLQVTAGGGMNILVHSGNGIFASKWFEVLSGLTITVPSNTALQPRLDSVIAQVDLRLSGRVGNIVYRTGTAAATPSAPAINQTEDVVEYRIANVLVGAGVTSISGSNITDLRGSASCPWVTSLIQQVDTSTLWEQFNSAYAEQFDQFNRDFTDYIEEQREAWETFVHTLTDELTVSMNVITLSSEHTTVASTTSVPIGIPSYNPSTDVLQVFINGLYAAENDKYTVSVNHTNITLANALPAGNLVSFVVFKSIIGGAIESAVSLIGRLDDKMAEYMADSGWVNLVLENGATAYNSASVPAVRTIGNRAYIRGAIKGVSALTTTIATLPAAFRPAQDLTFTTTALSSGGTVSSVINVKINTGGEIQFVGYSATINTSHSVSLAVDFLTSATLPASMLYTYKGTVASVADLPSTGNEAGDYYFVEADSNTYLWTGSAWQLMDSGISSATISAIVATVS